MDSLHHSEATRLLRVVAQGIAPVEADKQRRREAVDLVFSNYADSFAADCKGKGWSTLITRSLHLHVKPALREKALPTITRIDVVAVFDRMSRDQVANRRNVIAALKRLPTGQNRPRQSWKSTPYTHPRNRSSRSSLTCTRHSRSPNRAR